MKKPEALITLLEELVEEAVVSDIRPLKTSKTVIYTHPDAVNEEDGVVLNGEESALLFSSVDTTERLLDSFTCLDEASICFFDLELSPAVKDLVERSFVSVDEE